ncbi:two-partner secretion domain-containing protein [Methylotenera sp. G11]|uniref:two-partner secretion domain-containing protein n=1 Tax=Methylotenera sp. G11 TaxID=1506585 RepID=UPI000645699D|nr:hemagglutinin repeat-containing protein [Methylotenera sp. G11]
MNKNRFRIIFNVARGMMMVVAEFVKSHMSGAESTNSSQTDNLLIKNQNDISVTLRPLAFSLMCALGLVAVVPNPVNINPAHAEAKAATNVPGNQRATILSAPNGVEVVNIQTPSAAGVSRNVYGTLNVPEQGMIFNNSRSNVQTELGGWIQGNPWLATGTARVILNEINSSNPSYLNGYMEIAGSRAELIIANPNGISCNGCGFINASRGVLTTGTPTLSGGDLTGYRVTGGSVNIWGNGLDASRSNYTDIIARAVEVNAGIWANDLKITTGANQVNAVNTQTNKITASGAAPASGFALDVAALGGMYAGKITLIGTEAGLGVRNAGNIGAGAGQVGITADGQLINSGTISTAGVGNDLLFSSKGFNNSGTISSQSNLQISNQGDVANSGLIVTGQELKLDSSGALRNQQGTFSGQRLDIAAASLSNMQGTIQQTGSQAISLTAAALNNSNDGVIGNLPLTGGNSGGTGTGGTTGAGTTTPPPTTAGNDASTVVPVAPVVLAAGVINISGDVHNDGGQITANGDMEVTASNGLQNSAALNLNRFAVTGNTFSNVQGEIHVSDADIHTTTLDNSRGLFNIGNTLTLNAHDVINTQGTLQQLGTADLTITLAGDLDNTQGRIETNANNLTLAAQTLTNTGGNMTHAGSGVLKVTSATFNGADGAVQSNGALDFKATAATLDNGSTVAKQIAIDTTTLSNRNGEIIQTGASATSIKATTQLDNAGGVIASNGNTTLTTGSLINQGGTIQVASLARLTVNATGAVDNSALNGVDGSLQAGGAVTLNAASLNNIQGWILAGDMLEVTTSSTVNGIDNHQGHIVADDGVNLNSGAGINNTQAGIESAAGIISLTAAGAINNTSGLIAASHNTNVSAASLNNTDGQVSGLDTAITTTGNLDNTGNALIVAQRDLTLSTGKLNNQGDIQAIRHLTLNASDTITNSGTIYAQSNNTITTNSNLGNRGLIAAQGNMTVTADGTGSNISNIATGVMAAGLKVDGTFSAAGNLKLTATQSITSTGQYLSAGNQAVMAQSLDLADSTIYGKNLTLSADNGNLNVANASVAASETLAVSATKTLTTDAATVSADQLYLAAHDLSNIGGELVQTGAGDTVINLAGDLNNTQGRIATNSSNLKLAANTITNTSSTGKQASIEHAGTGTLTMTAIAYNGNAGAVQSNGNLELTAKTASLNDGSTIAEKVSIDTTTLSNQNGEIIQTGSGAASIKATTQLDNTGGDIASNGNTVFTVGDLINRGGRIQGAGSSNLTLNATGTVDNRLFNGVAGHLQAGGTTVVNAASVDNHQGQILAGDMLRISATGTVNGIDNSQGNIVADNGVSLASAANINNTQAAIQSVAGAVNVTAAGAFNNTSGLIAASKNTTVSAASLNNINGQIGGLDTSITTSGTLDNTGTGLIIAQRDLHLTTKNINNQSDIQATHDLALDASDNVANSGTLYAQGDASLVAQGDLTNSGLIAAHGNTGIHANGANSKLNSTATGVIAAGLNADGSLDKVAASLDHATGNLAISATQSVTALGQNLAAGDQTIIAQSMDISGSQTVARNLSLTAGSGSLNAANASIAASETLAASATKTLTTDAATVSADQLNLAAHDLSNIGGALVQTGTGDTTISLAGDLSNEQGRIATNSNNLTLAAQTITNTSSTGKQASIEHAGSGKLKITSTTFKGSAGQILSNGDLDFTATTATLDNASTIAKHINADTATLSNRSGEMIQTGSDAASIHASIKLDNTDGMIAGNGAATLAVGDLINQGGTIQTSGQVSGQAAGTSNLIINATGTIDNTSFNNIAGNIKAGGTLTLNADRLNNTQGQVTASNKLDVKTSNTGSGISNGQGLIAANQALTLSTSSLDNSSGTIASVHAGADVAATAGSINNAAGQISAAQQLHTNSQGLNNTDGNLFANSANIDTQSQWLDNTAGTIITTAGLDLQTGTLSNDAGLIQSGGNLVINTHGQALTNRNSGSAQGILSQGSATFTTGALNNQAGYIGAEGAIIANSAAISNHDGTMTSEATIALNGTSLDNQTGRLEALGNVNVNVGNSAANSINNQSGLLRSGQTLTLTSASVDNRNTQDIAKGIEGQSVLVSADQINNNTGAMRADNTLAIIGSGALNNSQGRLSSADTLSIADRLANANSNAAGKTLAVTNTNGTMIAGAGLNIDSKSLTGDGKVLSQGDLITKLTTDYTHTGQWQADGNATLVTTGTLTNQAQLLAGGNLDLSAANIDNQAGAEISAANTALHVSNTTTNRGLIDGSDTLIDTGTLNNTGTGRLYGDHVAIAAATLNNAEETVSGVTKSAVIAARDRLDIGAQTITNRNDALLFSVGDMAIGGSLDANHEATVMPGQAQANTLINSGATIEALGNLQLSAADLQNLNPALVTQEVQIATGSFHWFTPKGTSVVLDAEHYPGAQIGNFNISWRTADIYTFREYYRFTGTTATTATQVVTSHPGRILSGGNMTVSGNLTNSDSQMIAGGTLDVTGASLQNLNSTGQTVKSYSGRTYFYDYDGNESCSDPGDGCYDISYFGPYNPATEVTSFSLNVGRIEQLTAVPGTGTGIGTLTTGNATPQAEGANAANAGVNTGSTQGSGPQVGTVASVAGNTAQTVSTTPNNIHAGRIGAANVTDARQTDKVAAISHGTVQGISAPPQNTGTGNVDSAHVTDATQAGAVTTPTQTGPDTLVRTVSPNTVLPNNSLFHTKPDSTAAYYVETDPRFANYKTWLSSDYMLTALRYDPATLTKRLGDGFYEQRLIREQINQLTGRRFLTGYSNDETEYQALMTNGITFAQQYQLIPGVALSEAQIAQLTSDIVWLVEKTITLADGTTVQALVPQVYVRLQPGDIDGQGTLLTGNSINLKLNGDPATGAGGTLVNSGSIAGRTLTSISADNLHNLGGRISGNITSLDATQDINNLGGRIEAEDTLILQAGRDINIASTTQSSQNTAGASSFTRTNLDRIAGLYITNPNGILIASADHNLNLQGAMISNSGQNGMTVLNAGNNLNLTTLTTAEQNNTIKNSKNYIKHGNTQEIGTVIQTEGDILLNAGNDLTARAATVSSDNGSLNANAGNNLTIESGVATSNLAAARTTKKSGTFSSKKTERRDSFNDSEVISSTFSGDSVDMNAGNNLTIKGSNVVGTNNVDLNAGNNVTIESAQATHDETHYYKEKKTGFSASSTSIGYGSSKLTTTNDTQQVINVGSIVGSVEGDVNITSGNQYTQTASDVLTPQGDINISAQKVDINAATDTYANQQSMKYKQSGITVGVSSSALNLAQNVAGTTEATVISDSNRNKVLNALQTYANVSTLQEQGKAITSAVQAGNVQDAASTAGVKLSVSIGTSSAKSSSTTNVATQQGSLIKAGGDVNIKATQDNLTVQGSTIAADQNITLEAAKNINLIASTDTESNQSKNKSSSTSIGVSVGVGASGAGLSVDLAASRGKGSANSDSATYNNTHVTAGETLTLNSGNDTNLIGANAEGKQVTANASDLNIESLQDTSISKAKQSNTGISISVPVASPTLGNTFGAVSQSKQNSNSNYASVYEQSGIKAGEQGFNITTQGNTDLKGAVIESAAPTEKNQFTTGTLAVSNIQNHMDAEASSSGTTISTNMLNSKYGAIKGIAGNLQNHGEADISDSSTTLSAIAPATITITDEAKQQQLTGRTAEETVAVLNRDTTNTNRVLAKPDVQELQEKVQQEQADRMLAVTAITAFTDEAYRSRLQATPKVFKVECPQGADCQANPKLLVRTEIDPKEVANVPAGSIVAVNGILNDEERGAELAYQNTKPIINEITGKEDKPTVVYLMHIAPATNKVSELLGVAYEKIVTSSDYGLANFLGYTNGQELYADLLRSREQQATESLGHSRGTLVQEGAFTILANRPDENGNTYTNPNLIVRGVGGAADAVEYTDKAAAVQGSSGNKKEITYNYFSNDPVSTSSLSGGNIGTWTLKDLWQVFSTSNSMHSCYGTGAAGCTQVEIPVPGGPQGTLDGNAKLIQYQGGERIDNNTVGR